MDCRTCREAVSARIDGEAHAIDAESVDEHLRACAGCRDWQLAATRVTRMIRVRPVGGTPDLTAAIVATVGDPGSSGSPAGSSRADRSPAAVSVGGRGQVWQYLLAIVALAQVTMGLAQLLGVDPTSQQVTVDSVHFFNESTAWNIALGIGFAVVAVRPRLASGLAPTVGVFVVVLVGVSMVDLLGGRAELDRVGSHLLVVIGAGLLLMMHRAGRRRPGSRIDGVLAGERRPVGDEPMPDRSPAARPPGRSGFRPAGRHAA